MVQGGLIMSELPIAPVGRILKKADPTMKFSKEAKTLFAKVLEQEGLDLSRQAVRLAESDGRKTVMEKDIKRWKKPSELDTDDFIYKVYGRVRYNKEINHTNFVDQEQITALPVKFIKGKLLFDGNLYDANSVSESKKIMESYEKKILDNLMQPHWAYNIYEFRDWEPVEESNENTTKLTMWFDDYDGVDVFVDGILFQ